MIECTWRYLQLLWAQYPSHHRAYCTWSLPWCKFFLYQSARRRIWWHCSLQGHCIQITGRCFSKLIIGRLRHRRRNRRCTNVWSNCKGCRCRTRGLMSWVFTGCNTRKVGFSFCQGGPALLIWRCPLRVLFAMGDVPWRWLLRCHYCALCFLSSFIKTKI